MRVFICLSTLVHVCKETRPGAFGMRERSLLYLTPTTTPSPPYLSFLDRRDGSKRRSKGARWDQYRKREITCAVLSGRM